VVGQGARFQVDGLWDVAYALLVILGLAFTYSYFRLMMLAAKARADVLKRLEASIDRLYEAFEQGDAKQALAELNYLRGEIRND